MSITLELEDLKIGETVIKRKANLISLVYNVKLRQVVLNWEVVHFVKEQDGTYGECISYLIPNYLKESVANDSIFVNPGTGEILNEFDPGIGTNQEYCTQFEWFYNMGENIPTKVHDVIRYYGAGIENWDKI